MLIDQKTWLQFDIETRSKICTARSLAKQAADRAMKDDISKKDLTKELATIKEQVAIKQQLIKDAVQTVNADRIQNLHEQMLTLQDKIQEAKQAGDDIENIGNT